jgi:hypothetical protein
MFNDPKFKNVVNDIAKVLAEHNKEYQENILSPTVAESVSVCAEAIRNLEEAEKTAESVAKIMKEHYFAASREDKVEVDNEKSSEFYRRVYAAMKG